MVDTEGACPRLAMVGTVSKRGLIVRSLLPLLAPLTFLSRCESEPGVTDADTVPLRGAAAAFGAIVGSLPTDRQDELKTLPGVLPPLLQDRNNHRNVSYRDNSSTAEKFTVHTLFTQLQARDGPIALLMCGTHP